MNYLDIGKGETLVFIHGLGSTKESWKHQHALSNHYRLIIPNLRGHGDSTTFDNISIDSFAKDVLSILDILGIQKAHFCGLSMGGLVVQEIYRQQPNRVLSMILSNTYSYVSFTLGFIASNQSLKALDDMTKEEYATAAAEHCLFQKKPALIKEVQQTFSINREAYISASLSAIKMNFLTMLPLVKVPVLVIGSSDDAIIPIFSIYQTAWLIPRSEVYLFNECGHMPNIEKKEEYNDLLYRFLKTI